MPGDVRGVPEADAGAGHAEPALTQSMSRGRQAAAIALQQIGTPYRYGGSNQAGFDCSGLVYFAYGKVGVRTPRTTSALWRELMPIDASGLEVGDVLFFDIAGKVSHVGLYVGRGRFVHAPSSGRSVSIASLAEPFYREAFIRGGRL